MKAIPSEEEVRALFKKYDVAYENWKAPQCKTFGELMNSIRIGEVELVPNETVIHQHVHVSAVDVLTKRGDECLVLYEDRQELNDGTIKRRNFPNSIAEKIRTRRECPKRAIERGLREELQIDHRLVQLTPCGRANLVHDGSDWYPGLHDIYVSRIYSCVLPPALYREEYVELFLHKKIFHRWKKVTNPALLARLS